ncbi:hypothetical protein JTE90_013941 [Oedothorax gibbosus]|uniref:Uncharacterized protein n=1 Tax=Oedothorax gibbosus TaxID=931172 RepID=A0AAV6UBM3_9ARAC|nr:hypothetical protein JTE90_013941 [Oedothorax gibbosus]
MEKEKSFKKNGNVSSLQSGFKHEAQPGMNWREWKQKKKEEHKKWKEEKLEKKLKKTLETEGESQNKMNESMNETPSNKDNHFTVTIALPGSILDNAQSPELKTYLAGQIARAAAVFKVNEIVVFSETSFENLDDEQHLKLYRKNHGCMQLIKILQYLECPQYLRKYYFPIHKDLEYAGLLNPLDLPHHLRVDEYSRFREGTVINKPVKPGKGSFVYIGLKELAVIDKVLEENVRVTVKLDDVQTNKRHLLGTAVFTTFWANPPKGLTSVFWHLLIVFGGLKGIEGFLEADESIEVKEASSLFHYYLNTCPLQGSRTIRTEEAILITMAVLRPKITMTQSST